MKIKVCVKTNEPEDKIISFNEETREMDIAVTAQPENNRANIAMLKLLKRHFGKSAYLLVGSTAKEKLVEIAEE